MFAKLRKLLLKKKIVSHDDIHDVVKLSEIIDYFNANHDFLEIKQSNIPGAGYGLFVKHAITQEDIDNNDNVIILYGGIKSDFDYSAESDSDYIVTLPVNEPGYKFNGWIIDGEYNFPLDEAGRWANSSLEGADNAEIVYDDDETLTEPVMRIVAIKPINAGEEILVNYGEPFREGIREKLLRKSQEEPAKRVKNTDKCISCGMMALFREETSRTRVFCNETCQKKFY